MPKDYESTLKSVSKGRTPTKADKTKAAKITNAQRKKAGRPPAKFHRGK